MVLAIPVSRNTPFFRTEQICNLMTVLNHSSDFTQKRSYDYGQRSTTSPNNNNQDDSPSPRRGLPRRMALDLRLNHPVMKIRMKTQQEHLLTPLLHLTTVPQVRSSVTVTRKTCRHHPGLSLVRRLHCKRHTFHKKMTGLRKWKKHHQATIKQTEASLRNNAMITK